MFKNLKKLNIVFIVFLALLPLLWFFKKPGLLINGVDTNFPLNPNMWIYRRFFVWDALINAGFHFSSNLAGIFFHIIQVIPFSLGFNIRNVEIISILFWCSLVVVSVWLFANTILPKSRLGQLLIVCFYCLNPYLFNTWENIKVANLALAVSLPILLSILYKVKIGKISIKKLFFYSIITGFVSSGSGINPSYFLSLFFATFLFTLGLISEDFSFRNIKLRFFDLLVLWFGVFSANLFWIIPTASYVLVNVPSSQSPQGIGIANWVDSLSQNTSLFNVMRLQGAWDWYARDDFGFPYYIPYALKYFENPIFLIFSFISPAAAFLSLIFRNKDNKGLYVGLSLILVAGVFLGSGTHQPTGVFFQFLINHLPFFGIFRSPWYIFTSQVTIAYAALIGLFFYYFIKKFKFTALLIGILILIGNVFYNYPLITGKIFRFGRSDSFYVHFPDYVFQSFDWINKNYTGRILSYPDDEIEQFKWGYRGVESILQLGSNKEVVYSPIYLTDTPFANLVKELYVSIKKDQLEVASSIFSKIGIKTLFYKDDQQSIRLKLPQSFNKFPSKQIGEWRFIDVSSLNNYDKIYVTQNYYFAYPYEKAIKIFGGLNPNSVVLNPKDSVVSGIPEFFRNSSLVIEGENLQEKAFEKQVNLSTNEIGMQIGNLDKAVYKFNVPIKNTFSIKLKKNHLLEYGIVPEKNLHVVINSKYFILEPVNVNDYIEYKPIQFDPGDYTLTFNLKNNNYVENGDFTGITSINNQDGVYLYKDGSNSYVGLNTLTEEVKYPLKVKNFDPLAKYMISFDYQKSYGNQAGIVIRQFSPSANYKIQAENVTSLPEWKTYSTYFDPVAADSNLEIDLNISNKNSPGGTKILFDNVKVRRIFTNQLLLISRNSQKQIEPKIDFTKINPVKYVGSVKGMSGPQVLVFSENFNDGWQLKIINSKKQKSFHFSGNVFANSWYIDSHQDQYEFEIYYRPQNLLYLGVILSISITLVSVLYLFKKP